MSRAWTDTAITSKAGDQFDRAPYAVEAARLIASSHTWDDSVVFGLTGPWGSGKTSMLAMIEEELAQRHKDWRVARFTPWATGDVAGLLGDFYASLAGALPAQRGKKARKALGTLARVSAPVASLVPVAGAALAGVATASADVLVETEPWDVAFRKAVGRMKALDTPVLMIADDIDRLQTDELLALLKVVRLLGRFPGVHYLLAYDDATLFSALARADLVRGSQAAAQRFMEKIVQYPLVVPALTDRQLLTRLESEVDGALEAAGRSVGSSERVTDLGAVFRTLLPTPRAIDRYAAQLRHHLPLLAEAEINDEDVVVLSLVRYAFPTLYTQLPSFRAQLTSGSTGNVDWGADGLESEPFSIKPLLKSVPRPLRDDAATLLRDLFPALPAPGPQFAPQPRPKSVADDAYFDRYFAMTVPSHDIADAEVERMVSAARDGDESDLIAALTTGDPARISRVMTRATEVSNEPSFDDQGRLAVLRIVVPRIDDWSNEGLFTSPRAQVVRWSVALMLGLTDQVESEDVTSVLASAPCLATRTLLLHRVARAAPTSSWFPVAAAALSHEVLRLFLDNVELKDHAPDDENVGWWITFLYDLRQGPTTRRVIGEALAKNLFTVADLAARFVPVADDSFDGTRELTTVRRDEFNALVPHLDDAWFTEPPIETDPQDTSWANRRAAAQGRFASPTGEGFTPT